MSSSPSIRLGELKCSGLCCCNLCRPSVILGSIVPMGDPNGGERLTGVFGPGIAESRSINATGGTSDWTC